MSLKKLWQVQSNHLLQRFDIMTGIEERETRGIYWLPLTKPSQLAVPQRDVVHVQQASNTSKGLASLSVCRKTPLATAGRIGAIFQHLPRLSQSKHSETVTIHWKSNQNFSRYLLKQFFLLHFFRFILSLSGRNERLEKSRLPTNMKHFVGIGACYVDTILR